MTLQKQPHVRLFLQYTLNTIAFPSVWSELFLHRVSIEVYHKLKDVDS